MLLINRVSTSVGLVLIVFSSFNVSASSPEKYLKDQLPEQWTVDDFNFIEGEVSDKWWSSFNDAILDSLIVKGLTNNYNLDIAARRVQIANYNVRNARAQYFPNLGLSAGWSRSRNSGMTGSIPGQASVGSAWDFGLNMSWEIDLFGKIASSVGQSKNLYKASKADYNGAMLALAANIATNYIQLREWQSQREVAIEHIARQQRVVKITEDRLDCGLGTMLDVTQAREVYYSTLASIPNLENGIRTMINAIATLIGVYPEEIYGTLMQSSSLPDCFMMIPKTIPVDLLRRRPDINAAEHTLAASAQAVGISRKDFLPTLTLNGSLGTSAHDIGDTFSKPSFTYSISPTLSWTLFDGLARNNNLAIAKEDLQIQIDTYNFKVMTAVQDVDNALSSYKSSLEHIAAIENVIQQSEKALSLSLDLYKSSLTQFSNVVDAQMSLLENQNSLIVARGDALIDIINLYEALGGNCM